MKAQRLLLLLAVAGLGYMLFKKRKAAPAVAEAPATVGGPVAAETPAVAGAPAAGQDAAPAPVVEVVEETLHQHEGEDNPIVHAFEAALEQKEGHEAVPST